MVIRVNAWLPLLLLTALAPWVTDDGRAVAGYLTPPPVLDPLTESPVADAAMRGDAHAVRSLLADGADVNAAQGDGMTALHWSARNRDPSLADILLDAGADVHAGTRIGHYTALHMAGEVGAGEVVELLLDAGADPMARVDGAGHPTALHFAAASGSARAVEALLVAGADVNATEESWGQTPLIFAASKGRTEVVAALLDVGADPAIHTRVMDVMSRAVYDRIERAERNRRIREGQPWGPEVAAEVRRQHEEESRRRELAEAASAAEAETRMIEEPEPLSYGELVGGHGGLTALLHAAREGHAETALALIDGGADVNRVSAGDGTSPVLMATINGHYDLAIRFLERGADPVIASHAGATPLFAAINTHWAPKSRYPQQHIYMQQDHTYLEVMEKLLAAGADPNMRLTRHLWFMSYNFDLLQIDAKGATPFWRAAYALDVEAMKLLVAYGADPAIPTEKVPSRRYGRGGDDTTDASGLPPVPVGGPAVYPIHAAAGVGYGQGFAGNAHRHVPDAWVPAVRYLVEELGADVNARDHDGFSPLHHAAARGDNELILYLVEQGADVTVVSRRGQTTVDMANGPVQRIQPFPETIALLESLGAVNNLNCVSC
ncbi:MAG: ankyrin repeat domain-containing protein [Gemmatimonadota bacterium]|nr:ankyrin repeat domain-containing protein [Gemmatimonadota bacterium]